jgi:hypothetical protein
LHQARDALALSGRTNMNNQSVSEKQYVIILPNGVKHLVPYILFYCYKVAGLIRVSQKQKHVARIPVMLRAWPQSGSVLLSFELKTKPEISAGAIPSSLAALIRQSMCTDPNSYDEFLVLYSALEVQYGNQAFA